MPGDFHFPPPTPQERYASAAAKYAGSGGASPTNPASANASAGTTAGGRSNLPDGTAANDGSPLPDAPHPDPAPLPPTAMDVGGRVIDLADPQQCLLEPAFLVPRLALVPRFQGQAHHPDGRFWSVADHTAAVLSLLSIGGNNAMTRPELTIAAAVHDAHEVLMGDIPTPAKRLLEAYQPGLFGLALGLLDRTIGAAAGLPWERAPYWMERPELRNADAACGLAEGLAFLPRAPETADFWASAPEFARRAVAPWIGRPAGEAVTYVLGAILRAQQTLARRGRG